MYRSSPLTRPAGCWVLHRAVAWESLMIQKGLVTAKSLALFSIFRGFCGNQHLLGEDTEANCAPLLLAGRDRGAWPERQQGRQRGAGECAGHRQQLLFGGTCGGVVWLAGNRKRYRFNFFLSLLPLLLCFIKYPHGVQKKRMSA